MLPDEHPSADPPATSPPPPQGTTWTPLVLVLILLGAAGCALFFLGQTQWIDDSFISFRYARNLFEGSGLVYNAGDPVEGYTNFLWVLVAYVGLLVHVEPIYFTQGVSLVAQALTLVLVFRLGRASLGSSSRALIAPALLALQIGFLAYPMTGMETTTFAFFATLVFYLFQVRAYNRWPGRLALGAALLALALTRFDGFVLAGILTLFPLVVRRDLRTLRLSLGICLVGLVLYNAWRVSTYPTLLPNSFHAKISFSPFRVRKGLAYVWAFFESRQVILALMVLPFALRNLSALGRFLFWAVGAQLAYVALVGGDWMEHHRFILHVLPLVVLLAQEGAWSLWDQLKLRRPTGSGRRRTGLILATLLLGIQGLSLYEDLQASPMDRSAFFDPHEARAVGEALDRWLPEGSTVATEWGGIIPYYTRHEVLDTFGITDREISGGDFPSSIWGIQVGAEYVASRGPDLIVPCARVFATPGAALRSTRPAGPCHYRYYSKMDNRSMGYELKALKLAEGVYWPALVKRGLALGK